MPKELPVGRKYLLMLRDSLVQQLDEKHKQWRKNCSDETLTNEVDQFKKQVQEKWNARIHWPEPTLQGVTDYWTAMTPPYEAVKDMREIARRKKQLIITVDPTGTVDDALRITFRDSNGSITCLPHEIPIFIDPTILTLNDEHSVKKAVWDIVKTEIGKHNKIIKSRDFAVPAKEPEALAPILRCRQKTFDNYLRWYDQWIRGLSFRRITYVEMILKDPSKREELFKKYAEARQITVITSSMPDDLRRSITAKENAVRKGVDLIFFAIHRNKRFEDTPPEDITGIPKSGKPHKCTHDAFTCNADCLSPTECPSFQKLLQAC